MRPSIGGLAPPHVVFKDGFSLTQPSVELHAHGVGWHPDLPNPPLRLGNQPRAHLNFSCLSDRRYIVLVSYSLIRQVEPKRTDGGPRSSSPVCTRCSALPLRAPVCTA